MAALAVREDQRREDLRAVDDTAEVDAQRPVPGVEIRIAGITATADTGVVAQHVDAAERPQGFLRGRARLRAKCFISLPRPVRSSLKYASARPGSDVPAFCCIAQSRFTCNSVFGPLMSTYGD